MPDVIFNMDGHEKDRPVPDTRNVSRTPMACPCGRPLDLIKVGGDFYLGHIDAVCSRIVRGSDGTAVLDKLIEAIADGRSRRLRRG